MTDSGFRCCWRSTSWEQGVHNVLFGFYTNDCCWCNRSLIPVGNQTSIHLFIYTCLLFMSLPYGSRNLASRLFRKRRAADFIKPECCLPCRSSERGRGIKPASGWIVWSCHCFIKCFCIIKRRIIVTWKCRLMCLSCWKSGWIMRIYHKKAHFHAFLYLKIH